MNCFVPGCTAAVLGRCKTFGDGCQEHLDRWAQSSYRIICRSGDPARAATAKATFVRTLVAELPLRTPKESNP